MGGGCNDVCRNIDPSMGTFASHECIPHQSEWTQWTQWTVHSVYVPSLITYLRLTWVPHQNALAQNIKSASLGTPISALAHKRVMTKTATQIRRGNMTCDRHTTSQTTKAPANAEIGVPRLADFMF